MNIFKKIKDYDRVALALEQQTQLNNSLRVNLDVHSDNEKRLIGELKKLRSDCDELKNEYDKAVAERSRAVTEILSNSVTLSADKPEKRKYYTLVLQKELLPFIWEKDGKIFIRVLKPEQ